MFIVALSVHMLRVFFTGAFRKPRELNWVIGCLLLLLGTLEGFTGYSLPDDLLSGTGIRAADGFMKSMPVVGTYMSFFLFGGEFPGESIIPRLFTIHVLLIPGLLLALLAGYGITAGAIYRHFASKAELLLELNPRASLQVFDYCRMMPEQEQPKKFNQLLRDGFLVRSAAAGSESF